MSIPDNDRLLFRQVAEGSEQAFSALFNIYLAKLYPIIIKLTNSEAAVRDIIQETFIKLWLNRDKLAEMENPGGWLFRVAANGSYDYLRQRMLHDNFFKPITTEPDTENATDEGLDAKELQRLV